MRRAAEGSRRRHHRQDQRAGVRLQRRRPQSGVPRRHAIRGISRSRRAARARAQARRSPRASRRSPSAATAAARSASPPRIAGCIGIKASMGRVPLYPGCRDERYPGRVELGIARACRPDEPHRRRLRADAQRHRRPRSARPLFDSRRRLRLRRRDQRRHQGPARRLQRGLGLRRRRSGSAARRRRGGGGVRDAISAARRARRSRLGGSARHVLGAGGRRHRPDRACGG